MLTSALPVSLAGRRGRRHLTATGVLFMFVSLAAHAVGPVYRASDDGGRPPAAPAEPDATPLKWRVARHSLLEFVMAVVLLFGVIGIVRWVAGPSPISSAIPELRLQLLVIGAAVGVLLFALILRPAGKASGGHLNPAISLSMWRLGAFPGVAVVPYIVAQLAGSLLGALVGRAVWGDVIDAPPVFDAALQPGRGGTNLDLFPAEAASMAVIVMIVAWFLSVRRLVPFVPGLVGLLIGSAIVVLDPITGGCVNPAWQFGPALVAGELDFFWVYLIAPMVGSVVATVLYDVVVRRRLITHKLCGAPRRRPGRR